MTVLPFPPPPNPFYLWCIAPSGINFPIYTGDQQTAFNYIQTKLGSTGLRADYINLNIDFDARGTTLTNMTPPSGVSASDWSAVKSELLNEFAAVSNVRLLFTNLSTVATEIFASNSVTVNAVANTLDADLDDSATLFGSDLASGVLDELSELADPEVAAFLNALSALATYAGAAGLSSITDELSNLQNDLNDQFKTWLGTAAKMETFALQDWGNMQQISTAINDGSLSFTPDGMADAVSACNTAYEIYLWQALLPLVASPAASSFSHSSSSLNSSGSDCVTMQANEWAGNSGYHAYWLLIYSVDWWNPPTASCDRMFNVLGVSKDDVMNGASGWSAPSTNNVYEQDPSCVPSNK